MKTLIPKSYSIGELAESAAINVETVRFYERKKIIIQPAKINGRRAYPAEYLDHLMFIKHAQQVGFSLADIKELMGLKLNPNKSCVDVKKRTAGKIVEVSEKIKSLQKMLKLLKKFESKCDGKETTGKCTILDGLKDMEL